MKEILEIDRLKKIYHNKQGETLAVDNFSFRLKKGEFVAIVGPSGCGKSTILSILCGLESKSEGTIAIKNNAKLGYMLQLDSLFPWRNIYHNCLLGLEIEHQNSQSSKDYVLSLLKTYGLNDFIHSYPSSLSGGMRQRVG